AKWPWRRNSAHEMVARPKACLPELLSRIGSKGNSLGPVAVRGARVRFPSARSGALCQRLTRSQPLPFLPLHAQAELNQPRVECVADGSRSSALVEAILGQLEVGVIECVEKLRAELHAAAFPKGEVLQDGDIHVD